jgi:hypothetical protein
MVDGWLVIIDNCYLYVYIYISLTASIEKYGAAKLSSYFEEKIIEGKKACGLDFPLESLEGEDMDIS